MSIDPTSDAYREGIQSFKKNRGRYINPYSRDDARHNEFEGGWSHAVKRVPNFVAQELANRLRVKEEVEEAGKERKRQGAVNAYRNRKG